MTAQQPAEKKGAKVRLMGKIKMLKNPIENDGIFYISLMEIKKIKGNKK